MPLPVLLSGAAGPKVQALLETWNVWFAPSAGDGLGQLLTGLLTADMRTAWHNAGCRHAGVATAGLIMWLRGVVRRAVRDWVCIGGSSACVMRLNAGELDRRASVPTLRALKRDNACTRGMDLPNETTTSGVVVWVVGGYIGCGGQWKWCQVTLCPSVTLSSRY